MSTKFLVYVRPDGRPFLCEGGVYHPDATTLARDETDYQDNVPALADRHAAEHNESNRRIREPGRYEVRDNLDGVVLDDAIVNESLSPWQIALIEAA